MKTICIITILFFISGYCFAAPPSQSVQQTGKATISCFEGLPNDSSVVVEVAVNNGMNFIEPKTIYTTKTVNGSFTLDIPLNGPKMADITIGGRYIIFSPESLVSNWLLMEPGDNLTLSFNNLDQMGLLKINISGSGAEKFQVIKEVFIAARTRALEQRKIKSVTSMKGMERLHYYEQQLIKDMELLDGYKDRLSPNAYNVLRADRIVSNFDLTHMVLLRIDPADTTFKKEYLGWRRRTNYLAYLSSPVVAEALGHKYFNILLQNMAFLNHALQTGKLYNPTTSKEKHLENYKAIETYYSGNVLKSYLLTRYLITSVEAKGLGEELEQAFKLFLTSTAKNDPMYSQVFDTLTGFKRLNDRNTYSFTLTDNFGKKVSLGDFKGKVVVIDFWFTGCAGCKIMAPVLSSLEEKYSKEEVVFVSVSVDKDASTWKKYGIGNFSSATSVQLYTDGMANNHPLIKFFKVYAYPTLAIIDRNGNLYESRSVDPRTEAGKQELITTINNAIASK